MVIGRGVDRLGQRSRFKHVMLNRGEIPVIRWTRQIRNNLGPIPRNGASRVWVLVLMNQS